MSSRRLRDRRYKLPCRSYTPREVTIIDDIDADLKRRYEAFLAANHIGVAGIESSAMTTESPTPMTSNTNTNYNPEAEARGGRSGTATLARYLGAELERLYARHAAAD